MPPTSQRKPLWEPPTSILLNPSPSYLPCTLPAPPWVSASQLMREADVYLLGPCSEQGGRSLGKDNAEEWNEGLPHCAPESGKLEVPLALSPASPASLLGNKDPTPHTVDSGFLNDSTNSLFRHGQPTARTV